METVTHSNGQTPPAVLDTEWAKIEHAYTEMTRRDGLAEERAWRWERFAVALCVVWIVTLSVVVWLLIRQVQVHAFVQTVQLEGEKLVQIGVPEDLLAYTPPEGAWIDMLSQWVIKLRWKSEDTKALARREWAWLYRHTCGQARRLLQETEDREKPFAASTKLRSVEIISVTKTPTPQSYQVLWREVSTDKVMPVIGSEQWAGTFTVGRIKPATLTDALENRLGLCVTAWDISPTPSK